MSMIRFDGALGLAAIASVAVLVHDVGGLGALLGAGVLVATRALALLLWEHSSRTANVLAVVLVPAILLTYLLPKHFKQAIKELADREQVGPDETSLHAS